MNVFIFIQLLFGFSFFIRVLFEIYKNKLVSSVSLTKIGTLFLVWMVIGVFLIDVKSIFWLFWIYSPTCLLLFGKVLLRKHREKQFQKLFLFFLNNILLQMKGGNSFRRAFQLANQSNKGIFCEKFKQIYDFVVFSQHINANSHPIFLKEVIYELKQVDSHPHKAIQRLTNLRRKHLILEKFRQKSGQVLRQIRIQSLILTGLYFALLTFVSVNYGFKKHLLVISLSFLIFVLGLVGVFAFGRKIKWKI